MPSVVLPIPLTSNYIDKELEITLFEVSGGHIGVRKALPNTKRSSHRYWNGKKNLMNPIISIWVQRNISYRCICPWPNDRTSFFLPAHNLVTDFTSSYYRSSNGGGISPALGIAWGLFASHQGQRWCVWGHTCLEYVKARSRPDCMRLCRGTTRRGRASSMQRALCYKQNIPH